MPKRKLSLSEVADELQKSLGRSTPFIDAMLDVVANASDSDDAIEQLEAMRLDIIAAINAVRISA